MSLIPTVNEQDEIISYEEREDLPKAAIYRVSALWITNSRGDILLAQRKWNKKHDPGKWGTAVAGTVEKGETYDQNILKEMGEELGLAGVVLAKGPKHRIKDEYNYFCQWYTVVVDQPAEQFRIEEASVEQVKWFSRRELERDVRDHPERYLSGMGWALKNL